LQDVGNWAPWLPSVMKRLNALLAKQASSFQAHHKMYLLLVTVKTSAQNHGVVWGTSSTTISCS